METTIDIRKKIHTFIDNADERILKIISEIISIEGFDGGQKIPDSFYEELDRRKEKHLKGESKSYSLSEVKERARGAVK